jgi:virginiamycin A acetyltransferase
MIRKLAARLAEKIYVYVLVQNEMESLLIRRHFENKYEVIVGLYSYGCFDSIRFPARTRIGRYCSIARTARVVDANHPTHALTTHPYLYDPRFGVIKKQVLSPQWMTIEDDVWIGQNAVIMPGCKHIGRGAIIGAGAVVTRNVPSYAIVTGVPATVRRSRFSPEVVAAIEATGWWRLTKSELAAAVQSSEILALNLELGDAAAIAALFEIVDPSVKY